MCSTRISRLEIDHEHLIGPPPADHTKLNTKTSCKWLAKQQISILHGPENHIILYIYIYSTSCSRYREWFACAVRVYVCCVCIIYLIACDRAIRPCHSNHAKDASCVCVCVFIKLHITAQSGLVILVILCHSH